MSDKVLDIKQLLKNQYGEDFLQEYENVIKKGRKSSFRVNRILSLEEEITDFLEKEGISYDRLSWFLDMYIIENSSEKAVRETDSYREGRIYFQNPSSVIPVLLLDPKEGDSILDMCAAPGGKTCLIASLTLNRSQITACEKQFKRAERLKYNLEKQGVKNTTVLTMDALKLDELFRFDKILLDAPCSGSGTFAKEEDFFMHKEDYFRKLNDLQKKLIRKACNMLKSGGELVYSTCSLLKEENEEVLKSVLTRKDLSLVPADCSRFSGVKMLKTDLEGTVTVCPDEITEGFFTGKIKKN